MRSRAVRSAGLIHYLPGQTYLFTQNTLSIGRFVIGMGTDVDRPVCLELAMKIAVLGTGTVGQALAGRLAGLGHAVTVGTRDTADTLARTAPDAMGNPPYAA